MLCRVRWLRSPSKSQTSGSRFEVTVPVDPAELQQLRSSCSVRVRCGAHTGGYLRPLQRPSRTVAELASTSMGSFPGLQLLIAWGKRKRKSDDGTAFPLGRASDEPRRGGDTGWIYYCGCCPSLLIDPGVADHSPTTPPINPHHRLSQNARHQIRLCGKVPVPKWLRLLL